MKNLDIFYSNYIKPYINAFWELLYPVGISCIACKGPLGGNEKYSLCPSCYDKIHFFHKGRWIQIPSIHDNSFIRVYSPTAYDEITKKLVARLKYNNETYLARIMAEIMMDYLYKEELYFTTIVAVPLHASKKISRGFNQAFLLAEYISKLSKVPNIEKGLSRHKNTKAMHLLTKEERRKNVEDAFIIRNPKEFYNQHILLIDDIVTTGATLESCNKALVEAGAASVTAITFARRMKEEG
ncbi:ComF family protein [Alkaliphilus serpentinus]|uniref:ComF family protein n=1 Tax=Alkaliphilus serpentinus TaxID=1482731 RepID=A0A833HMI6_9FIRM|nr:ComF family protein [Alkaliphilus serpentinus]KAB3526651.1 ComF family protein [Alkaliphilus serpentinus]